MSKEQDHEDPITSIYVDSNSGRYVTSDNEGIVKVWTKDKQLIREVTFPEVVKSVMFIDSNCDILIGHGKYMSLMHLKEYNVKKKIRTFE